MIDRCGTTIAAFIVDAFFDENAPRRGYWLSCERGHKIFATVALVEEEIVIAGSFATCSECTREAAFRKQCLDTMLKAQSDLDAGHANLDEMWERTK